MKTAFRFITAALVLAFVASMVTLAAPAPAREHPAYLHALSDLRQARALLQRPDGGELREQEKKAIREIDDAISEIKKAAIDDGKNLNDHPPADARMDWAGRLHRAVELLDKARRDVSEEEDNQFAQGLQQRAVQHIDKAHHHVEEAIQLVR